MNKAFLLEFDYNNVMADVLGPKLGLSKKDLKELEPVLAEINKDLTSRRQNGEMPFFNLPFQTKELRRLKRSADEIRKRVQNFVVLGIGGSATGTKAVFQALRPLNHNLLERSKRRFPRLFVADNIDPEGMIALLNLVDPRHTVFNVVSQSGTTPETLAQFMAAFDVIRKSLGKSSLKDHIVVTTGAEPNPLRELAKEFEFDIYDIPGGMPPRFSVLSPVSLLPLSIAGVNVAELLRGAATAADVCSSAAPLENPAYLFSALAYALNRKKGRSNLVFMPYAKSLTGVADWFLHLWAESLGKAKSLNGKNIYAGQTPIKAEGVTDQHTQFQLFMEGPRDKVVVFVAVDAYRGDMKIPSVFKDRPEFAYLAGRSFSELITAEQAAAAQALTDAGRPNLTLRLPKVTPAGVGYLMYVLETAAVVSGGLYQVDPLDNPGIEPAEMYTFGLMNRKGYEKYKADFDKATSKKQYVITQ